jgi:hypothetical protein
MSDNATTQAQEDEVRIKRQQLIAERLKALDADYARAKAEQDRAQRNQQGDFSRAIGGGGGGVAPQSMISPTDTSARSVAGTTASSGAQENTVVDTVLAAQGQKLSAMCAILVNRALAAAGVQGTGSGLASSFQTYGQSVRASDARRGDIFYAGPSGAGDTGHVGVLEGPVQGGRVPVASSHISGSGSPGVSGEEYRNANNLMFRRPPYTDAGTATAADVSGGRPIGGAGGISQSNLTLAGALPAARSRLEATGVDNPNQAQLNAEAMKVLGEEAQRAVIALAERTKAEADILNLEKQRPAAIAAGVQAEKALDDQIKVATETRRAADLAYTSGNAAAIDALKKLQAGSLAAATELDKVKAASAIATEQRQFNQQQGNEQRSIAALSSGGTAAMAVQDRSNTIATGLINQGVDEGTARAIADDQAKAAQAADDYKKAILDASNELKSGVKSGIDALVDGMTNGVAQGKSFKDIVSQIGLQLSKLGVDMFVKAPLKKLADNVISGNGFNFDSGGHSSGDVWSAALGGVGKSLGLGGGGGGSSGGGGLFGGGGGGGGGGVSGLGGIFSNLVGGSSPYADSSTSDAALGNYWLSYAQGASDQGMTIQSALAASGSAGLTSADRADLLGSANFWGGTGGTRSGGSSLLNNVTSGGSGASSLGGGAGMIQKLFGMGGTGGDGSFFAKMFGGNQTPIGRMIGGGTATDTGKGLFSNPFTSGSSGSGGKTAGPFTDASGKQWDYNGVNNLNPGKPLGDMGGPNIISSPRSTGGDTTPIGGGLASEGNDASAPGGLFGSGFTGDMFGGGDIFSGGADSFAAGDFGSSAAGDVGGAAAGGGADAGSIAGIGDIGGAFVAHEGGPVGTGMVRTVPPGTFARAPRLHGGGLMPDEVPIIGQKGERVLNRADTAAYDRGARGAGQNGGTQIYAPIHVHANDADSFRRSESQIHGAQSISMQRAARNF